MELPEGFTVLRDYVISHGPLQRVTLVRIIKQIVTAISTCILNGVDHRNISPENVLFEPKSQKVKIIGFGHAATLAESKEPYRIPTNLEEVPPEANQYGVCSPLQTIVWR